MIITNSLTTLHIVVPDIATVISSFNRIRLYKSIAGASGVYTEITASSAGVATLTGTIKEPFVLNGKEFIVTVNGTSESFTFGAVTTAADAAAAITASTSANATDVGGYVVVTSPTTGTGATLQLEDSSAGALALGLYQGDQAYGYEAWATLVGGTKLYTIQDYQGSTNYWYKRRYYNVGTATYGDYSAPFKGLEEGSVAPANIIYGIGYLVDTDGTPLANTKILIYNKFLPTIVDSKIVAGTRSVYTTDNTGYVSVPLVKGSRITMAIELTKLSRDITVPSSGDTFDLMTTAVQDSIGIVAYDLPDATRVTL